MTTCTLERPMPATAYDPRSDYAQWVVAEDGCSYWGTEEEWASVENMRPSGNDLDRFVDQFPAPKEWHEEWTN